jgi:mono/diheme cytochrome c family protein
MKLHLAAAVMLGIASIGAVPGQAPSRSAREGVYTTAQAAQGKRVYVDKCTSCHGSMETSTPEMAALLNDVGFQNLWRDRSLARLFSRIRETMPQDKPNSLSPEETADVVAYILSANALPPGETVLPFDLEILKEIRLDAGEK